MVIYIPQCYVDCHDSWKYLTAVPCSEDREAVLDNLQSYMEKQGRYSRKAKTRRYRLAKFHYGGCRHVENPRAK